MISPRDHITFCYDRRTGKVGVARCHPSDTPYTKIGAAIAYARCKGYEIPKQKTYKTLEEMKNGEVFFTMVGGKYIYIGKCVGYQEGSIGYAVQSKRSGKICILSNGNFNYEMVD